jgi:hypothetical protein
MSIATWNCCGLATTLNSKVYCCKLDAFFRMIPMFPDVVLLQEVHLESISDHVKFHCSSYDYQVFASLGSSNSRGVMVLCRSQQKPKQVGVDSQGRVCLVEIGEEGDRMVIGSVYAPASHSSKEKWFRSLMALPKKAIVGGDFNIAMDKEETSGKVHHKEVLSLVQVLNKKGWGVLGEVQEDTFVHRNGKYAAVLDRFIGDLNFTAPKISVTHTALSDHSILLAQWNSEQAKPRWRFNPARANADTINSINKLIIEWGVSNKVALVGAPPKCTATSISGMQAEGSSGEVALSGAPAVCTAALAPGILAANKFALLGVPPTLTAVLNLGKTAEAYNGKVTPLGTPTATSATLGLGELAVRLARWDNLKSNIASCLQLNAVWISREKAAEKAILMDEFRRADPKTKLQIKVRLQKKRDEEAKVKSYGRYAEQIARGSKSTPKKVKWFSKRVIPQLGDGSTSSLEVAGRFYKQLFEPKPVSTTEGVKCADLVYKRINEEQQRMLDAPLNAEELAEAVNSMANGKSPGLDGLSVEAYKLWPNLVSALASTWSDSVACKQMPKSTKEGLITMIFKKGDASEVANYRPITLCNVDYKIIAKALARRLAKVISSVVDSEQTGFIPGRDIRTNILLAQSVMLRMKDNGAGAALLLDFEKAYDRLNRSFLWLVMEKMGFGERFIEAIKVLHKGAVARVEVNNEVSEVFPVEGGVRQGCPIAPLLFALATVPLIKILKKASGIRYAGEIATVSMYADDTVIFIDSVTKVRQTISLVKRFEAASGAKLNVHKSVCLTLEKAQQCPMTITDNDRLLGYSLGARGWNSKHWEGRVQEVEARAASWNKAKGGIFERAKAVNTFMVSKLQYSMNFGIPPRKLLTRIRKACAMAVFGTGPRVKREIATSNVILGGLGVVEVYARCLSTLASWVTRVDSDPTIKRIWECESKQLVSSGAPKRSNNLLDQGLVGQIWYAHLTVRKKTGASDVGSIYKALMPENVANILGEKGCIDKWKWLSSMPLEEKYAEFRWRMWHGALKLKKNIFFGYEKCPWCNFSSKGAHVVSSCHFALECWSKVAGSEKFVNTDQWRADWVAIDIHRAVIALMDIKMILLKFEIWKAYCETEYGGKTVVSTVVVKRYLNRKYKYKECLSNMLRPGKYLINGVLNLLKQETEM